MEREVLVRAPLFLVYMSHFDEKIFTKISVLVYGMIDR